MNALRLRPHLTEDEVQLVLEGRRPHPAWLPGDAVRVVASSRSDARSGRVRLIRRHHLQCQYYIEEAGESVSRRFWASDLAAVSQRGAPERDDPIASG